MSPVPKPVSKVRASHLMPSDVSTVSRAEPRSRTVTAEVDLQLVQASGGFCWGCGRCGMTAGMTPDHFISRELPITVTVVVGVPGQVLITGRVLLPDFVHLGKAQQKSNLDTLRAEQHALLEAPPHSVAVR